MNNPENLPVAAAAYPPPAAALSLAAADLDAGPAPTHGGLKRYLSAVRHYKWLVLAATVVGTTGAVRGRVYLRSRYTAEATLWFAGESRQDQMQGPIQSSGLLQAEAWVELVRSWTVLDYVTMEHGLYIDARARDLEVLE